MSDTAVTLFQCSCTNSVMRILKVVIRAILNRFLCAYLLSLWFEERDIDLESNNADVLRPRPSAMNSGVRRPRSTNFEKADNGLHLLGTRLNLETVASETSGL